ncbi:hypothetical protein [Yunchengibacter salinarum]|uniref:hypothetical protein n=1 Tax=Yunchengibacter salinarum TaxID=3133399 RepID=UPI0035B667CC
MLWLAPVALAPLGGQGALLALDAADDPFEIETSGLTAGYAKVSWRADGPVRLQLDRGSGFSTVYEGPDDARTFSGLPDGTYRVRLMTPANGEWSAPRSFTVSHHSPGRAFTFFGVGAAVFAALIVLMVLGLRRDRNHGDRNQGAPS